MSWIKKILILLVPISVGFLTLEAGIRIIQYSKLAANAIQYSLYSDIYSDQRKNPYLFWHKPNVNVKLEDGHYDFTFITNKFGHRSLSDNVEFEKSIVFIGDSIIEGASVENNETLPYLVSKNLNIPAVNLGLGSSNTVQEYLLGKEKIMSEFNMKTLVLGFCLNDISQNTYRRSFDPQLGNWTYFDTVKVDDELTSHAFSNGGKRAKSITTANYVKDIVKRSEAVLLIYRILKNGLNLNPSQRTYTAESWKNTEYFLRKFLNLASSHDAHLIVIIFPYQDQIEGRMDFNEQVKLKQILDRNQIEYFDPSIVLTKNKSSVADASNLYHDNTHPNKLGTSIIANAFSNYLFERYAEHR